VEGSYRRLNFVLKSVPGGATVVVIGITGSEALVVQWDSVVESTVEAWTASEMLLHRGQGAGTARKISVSTNGAGASCEVMVQGISAVASARVRVAGPRAERRGAGVGTAMRGNAAVLVGGLLPVDGLETLVEFLGTRELPLAEDGPNDEDTTNGSSNSDEDCGGRSLVLIRGRSGGGQSASRGFIRLINRCDTSNCGYHSASRRGRSFREVKGRGGFGRGC